MLSYFSPCILCGDCVQALQKEREDKLAATLKNKLEPFVEGQTNEFIEWANEEAKRLSSAGTYK